MQTIAGSPLLARLERDSALVLRSSSLQGASANRNRSFRITSEDSGVSIFWSCYGSWTHWAEILLGYLAKSWQQKFDISRSRLPRSVDGTPNSEPPSARKESRQRGSNEK